MVAAVVLATMLLIERIQFKTATVRNLGHTGGQTSGNYRLIKFLQTESWKSRAVEGE
jgi:hypothetical protein